MYGTLAGWRAYATARGDNAPTASSDALATAALVRASDYIRTRYVANLLGSYGADFIPPGDDLAISVRGAYIAAGLELATPGFFAQTYTPAQQKVLTGAGSIRWSVVGNSDKTYAAMPVSTLIEALFEPYIRDRDGRLFMGAFG
jgi:hypothetical protein